MAGPYDTYDYSRSIQGLPAAFIQGQGRIQQAQRDREAEDRQMRMLQIQQNNQTARDKTLHEYNMAEIDARRKAQEDSLQRATRKERETQYMVAYPNTKPEELKNMTDADLISGIQKHGNEALRDSAVAVDQSIKNEAASVEAILAAKNAADQREIKQRVANDPNFLSYVEKNVHPGWLGGKGKQFAEDFASGKVTLSDLLKDAKNPSELLQQYAQATEVASQGMKDKNGQPVIDAGTLSNIQQKIQRIDDLQKLRQKYIGSITDPKIQIEALGQSGQAPTTQNTFRDNDIGGVLPGPAPASRVSEPAGAVMPPAAARPGGPENMQFQSAPSNFSLPPTASGPTEAIPSYVPPGQVSANSIPAEVSSMRQPTLGAYVDPNSGQLIRPPGAIPVPQGANGMSMASIPMMSSQQNIPAVQAPATAPGNGMPASPGASPVQAAANPDQAAQASALMMKVLGTTDINVRQKSVDLARSEGMDDNSIRRMFFDAAHGDPTSLQRIRTYVQRAQTGQMMTPPAAYPAATAP